MNPCRVVVHAIAKALVEARYWSSGFGPNFVFDVWNDTGEHIHRDEIYPVDHIMTDPLSSH